MGNTTTPVRTIMDRTMSNLKLVQRLHKEAVERGDQVDELGPFEVTQLVNSFSGALAHPWERVFATDRQF